MVNRSIASLFRLGAAATLVVLGTTALLQVGGAKPAGAIPVNHFVYGWGNNIFGDLGVGTPDNNTGPDTCGPFQPCSWTPVQMSLPAGVTGIATAAGQDMSYAIGSNGNLYASGENEVGQLGDGTNMGPTCAHRLWDCQMSHAAQCRSEYRFLRVSRRRPLRPDTNPDMRLARTLICTPGVPTQTESWETAPPRTPTPQCRCRCRPG